VLVPLSHITSRALGCWSSRQSSNSACFRGSSAVPTIICFPRHLPPSESTDSGLTATRVRQSSGTPARFSRP